MIQIQGFKNVTYQAFQKEMEARFDASGKKEIELALKLGLKSTATIKNAFRKDEQVVSDEVLSGLMDLIDLRGFVLWIEGKRNYYIKI